MLDPAQPLPQTAPQPAGAPTLRDAAGPRTQAALAALGARLRERRTRAGLSQGAVGQAAGVTGAYVGMLERGLRNPGYATVVELARALGVAARELMS